ncbi:hypothetical protein SRDD_30400 [Serratia sp. DD3]|nr:hypothetical protein SRDD_30400 [Serratia sp. DD3]
MVNYEQDMRNGKLITDQFAVRLLAFRIISTELKCKLKQD